VKITYEAYLTEGVSALDSVDKVEKELGGELGYDRIVYYRSSEGERADFQGHWVEIRELEEPPFMKRERVASHRVRIRADGRVSVFDKKYDLSRQRQTGASDENGPDLTLFKAINEKASTGQTRRIAGRTCEVRRNEDQRGKVLRQCVAEIRGEPYVLNRRWDSVLNNYEKQSYRAADVEAGACIPDARFRHPDSSRDS